MPKTSKRIEGFTESVIRKMTRIADECGAINLSQGFPDFDPPGEILSAAEHAGRHGPHQYAVTWGAPKFRSALASKLSRFMAMDIDPEKNIVVTCGSTEAMMASMMSCCNPGDKVVIFSPFYENYTADTILSGAEPIYVALKPPSFSFDRDELRHAFEQKPKALILCNPSNPSGKVFTPGELQYIASLAIEFDTFVITDEVYEHIVYPPHKHTYLSSLPGMWERTLSCSSLSKTYSVTGWRLGYVAGPEEVIDGVKKVHDFLTVGAAAPLQEAAVTGLLFPDSYYDELATTYRSKRDLFLGYLRDAGLSFTEPQGAYYVMLHVGEFGFGDDNRFCEWMAREIGVAAVPGSSFFREPVNDLVRLHFAKKPETLKEAGRRLGRLRG
ncbi:aminotransferase class I/II-fold pyridoxal phosphate-dependent enzyme [Chitinispirillales bacterium ANBcel5]|uniref:pyridoxal phosphate-dependent aminotransferase n=1 Tax=Cellulosispirillum alkaliphilum TaxID=3039283 RepID=UPI002A561F46|nr:aminotransferase class I/II-fold pyridoxal phosphate-dependent enzyme [Chitinispirillales bacterium ANBcel5]